MLKGFQDQEIVGIAGTWGITGQLAHPAGELTRAQGRDVSAADSWLVVNS